MPSSPDETWRIALDQDAYAALAGDDRFIHLIALARCVNALRFAQSALGPAQGDDSPLGIRTRLQSFFYTTALLFEGRKLAGWLAKQFRGQSGFADMAAILANREISALFAETLKPLRNGFVFHFDPDEVREALKRHGEDQPVFVLGQGRTTGQTYYQLADMIAVRSMIAPPQSENDRDDQYRTVLRSVANFAISFNSAADKLIAAALLEMGWHMEST